MKKLPHFRFGPKPAQPLIGDASEITFIRRMAYYKYGEAGPHQSLCNLSRPDASLLLRAPLARETGGLGLCRGPVFRDTSNPDYRALRDAIVDAAGRLATGKRFDMAGFQPNEHYVREMQRYGVLPKTLTAAQTIDSYATDQAYWRSFWHQPTTKRKDN